MSGKRDRVFRHALWPHLLRRLPGSTDSIKQSLYLLQENHRQKTEALQPH